MSRKKNSVTRKGIDELKAALAAREGKPGFAANVEAIKQHIAKLEALNAG